jgi:hypothetical protein
LQAQLAKARASSLFDRRLREGVHEVKKPTGGKDPDLATTVGTAKILSLGYCAGYSGSGDLAPLLAWLYYCKRESKDPCGVTRLLCVVKRLGEWNARSLTLIRLFEKQRL